LGSHDHRKLLKGHILSIFHFICIDTAMAGLVYHDDANEISPKNEGVDINVEIARLDQDASRFYRKGEYSNSVEVLRHSYNLRSSFLGKTHVDSLTNLNNLAAALGRAGFKNEAEKAFRDALIGRMNTKGKENKDTYTTMSHLGVVLKQLGQFEEAEALLYTSLEGFHKLYGVDHICTSEVAFSYGVLSVQQGKRNKAAYCFSVAVIGLSCALGTAHQHTQDAISWMEKCRDTYNAGSSNDINSGNINNNSKNNKSKAATNQIVRIDDEGNKIITSTSKVYNIPSPHAPLPSVFDMEEMDYTEGIYKSKSDWKKLKNCTICTIKYTMTRREHHCRVCSSSICDDCSQCQTYVLEFSAEKKQRMCSNCEAQGFE